MAPHSPIVAQTLERDAAGNPCSTRYGDVYASRHGALGQARAVFLQGCGLLEQPATWAGRRQFVVLETGFGLGTNFLATWQAWRTDPQRPQFLHYVAVELHPLRAEDLIAACADPALRVLAQELARHWPAAVGGLHPVELEGGQVRLLLAFGDARAMLDGLELGADALYLDGFAPARNPDMWTPEVFAALARLARPGARLGTYTVARRVCDGLRQVGFEVRKLRGYGTKSQRLQGLRTAPPDAAPARPHAAAPGPGVALVIGAGLGGAACARALAERGWAVQVLDASGVAGGASGLPAGLAHLRPALHDDRLARLTRAGLAWLRATLPGTLGPQLLLDQGVLMADMPGRRPRALGDAAWPEAWLRHLDAQQAAQEAGVPLQQPGWWTAGGAVAAADLCRAWLDHPLIRVQAPAAVRRLRRADGAQGPWQALDAQDQVVAQAPVCVVAAAGDSLELLARSGLAAPPGAALRLQGGQGFVIDADAVPSLRGLRRGIMGSTYALPLPPAALQGAAAATERLFLGATYEVQTPGAAQTWLPPDAVWRHIACGLRDLVPDLPDQAPSGARLFTGVRAMTRDRLPLIGAWPDWSAAPGAPLLPVEGLFVSAAMGSRGLLMAALGARCIAGRIEGEPAPLERDLMALLDPARLHRPAS